jgi:hypothetical protein
MMVDAHNRSEANTIPRVSDEYDARQIGEWLTGSIMITLHPLNKKKNQTNDNNFERIISLTLWPSRTLPHLVYQNLNWS